jgi:hypothetical protein
MAEFTIKLIDKVQTVNNLSFEQVAISIGYDPEKLLLKLNESDEMELIDLLFVKHPNSLKGMR